MTSWIVLLEMALCGLLYQCFPGMGAEQSQWYVSSCCPSLKDLIMREELKLDYFLFLECCMFQALSLSLPETLSCYLQTTLCFWGHLKCCSFYKIFVLEVILS
ncbi:uncharacterized protein LOC329436 precursor [Mus musculus]|uniref:Secreted protein n=1 Tax=Mus musculus TaxID=10090 RepID=Q8BRI5_MOUSE|nr:uncharacterized protein LOC329436 precursor [Mus musculus]BAC31795.1 unnamed protein product [Mus musculus]|eukprot:NP_808511.1 uncharacterized protein LOC329436 precursor [Mus musculus]